MSANIWDQRTLKTLTVLVLLLLGPTLWSWFSPLPGGSGPSAQKQSRGLASVLAGEAETSSKTGRLSRPVLIEWNATAKNLNQEVFGTHLRLKGLLKGLNPESIVNETNGFTAAVFKTRNEYSTDFIELKEGPNTITVELKDSQGKKITKKIEVTRRQPASL
ncbi:MAG: hypothetical protein ACK5P7_13025 [Bdellovibrio sp.]|jgi:hypothetical protein